MAGSIGLLVCEVLLHLLPGVVSPDTDEFADEFSLTMFLQDMSFTSRAPTFRSRSPTMFSAEMRADGVRACCCCCWKL